MGKGVTLYGCRNESIYSPDGNKKITTYYYVTLVSSMRSTSDDPWINQRQTNSCVDHVASCCIPCLSMQIDGNLVINAAYTVYKNSGTCNWWQADMGNDPLATTFVVHNDVYAYWMIPTQIMRWSTPSTPPKPLT